MSIVTKTGDEGTTGLMFGRRVSKTDPRVEACGTVDELNAAIGLARAHLLASALGPQILQIQGHLVSIMGELGTDLADKARYRAEGYPEVGPHQIELLESWVRELESRNLSFRGWATPGNNVSAGALDLARAICRRAERRVAGLLEQGILDRGVVMVYLNRLSDLLWLFARWAEQEGEAGKSPENTPVSGEGPHKGGSALDAEQRPKKE